MAACDDSKYTVYQAKNAKDHEIAHESEDGTTSQVSYAHEKAKARDVIVKRIYRDYFLKEKDAETAYHQALARAFNEIEMAPKLQEGEPVPFVPLLHGTCKNEKETSDKKKEYDLVLIFELVGGMNALEMLRMNQKAAFSMPLIAESIMVGAIVAQAMEKKGLIYNGFRLSHFVYNGDTQPFIVDFGSSTKYERDNGGVPFSPPASRAPEQWKGEAYTSKADVFGLGIMLYNMITRELSSPFDLGYRDLEYAERSARTLANMNEGIAKMLQLQASQGVDVSQFDAESLDLLKKMLRVNPSERPSFDAIIAHRFFAKHGITRGAVLKRKSSGRNFNPKAEEQHKSARGQSLRKTWQRRAPKDAREFIEGYLPRSNPNSLFTSKLSEGVPSPTAAGGDGSNRRTSRRSRTNTGGSKTSRRSSPSGPSKEPIRYSTDTSNDGSITPTQQTVGGASSRVPSQMPRRIAEEPSRLGVRPRITTTDMTSISKINAQLTDRTIRIPGQEDSGAGTGTDTTSGTITPTPGGATDRSTQKSNKTISDLVDYPDITFLPGSSAYPPGSSGYPISNYPSTDDGRTLTSSNSSVIGQPRLPSQRPRTSTKTSKSNASKPDPSKSRSRIPRPTVTNSGRSKTSTRTKKSTRQSDASRSSQPESESETESPATYVVAPGQTSISRLPSAVASTQPSEKSDDDDEPPGTRTPTQATTNPSFPVPNTKTPTQPSQNPSEQPPSTRAPTQPSQNPSEKPPSTRPNSRTRASKNPSKKPTESSPSSRAVPMPSEPSTGRTIASSMHSNWSFQKSLPSSLRVSGLSSTMDSSSSTIGNDIIARPGRIPTRGSTAGSMIHGITDLSLPNTDFSVADMDPNDFVKEDLSRVDELSGQSSGSAGKKPIVPRKSYRRSGSRRKP